MSLQMTIKMNFSNKNSSAQTAVVVRVVSDTAIRFHAPQLTSKHLITWEKKVIYSYLKGGAFTEVEKDEVF